MKIQSKLALAAAMLLTVTTFSANAIPGIRSQKLAQCKSEPAMGDSAVGGQFAAVVTYEIREFGSYHQVKIYNAKSRTLIKVLTGGPNRLGDLVLNQSTEVSRAGFSQVFTLKQALGTWTLTRDFGPRKTINFTCSN